MIKTYELMVIITPKLSEDEAAALNESWLTLAKEQGGNIIKTDTWGKRLMAYPINKLNEGWYFVNYFELESTKVKGIKQQLNINERVLRHMFIVKS
jgi:small subunit ribosomal protein S6